MTEEGERVIAGVMRVPSRAESSVSFRDCNSLKMRYTRGDRVKERQEREKEKREREMGFESEGRTGVRGKVGVPNRGVGG